MSAAEPSGALPRFSTKALARWEFAMKIVGGDRGQQRFKGQGRAYRNNDESAVLHSDIDVRPRRQMCVGGEGPRDAEGKTVAPFANGDAHETSAGRAGTAVSTRILQKTNTTEDEKTRRREDEYYRRREDERTRGREDEYYRRREDERTRGREDEENISADVIESTNLLLRGPPTARYRPEKAFKG